MVGVKVNQRVVASCVVCWSIVMLIEAGRADRLLRVFDEDSSVEKDMESEWFLVKFINFLWLSRTPYHHVWPELEFGWKLVVGTTIGFFGAALGSIGGVGGGGIFVPMLTLIIGFDPKSSTAISKCMIMGAAGSTVYYNLKLRHPTLDLPIIDYDLALLFQPMLMLGISIGVVFNIIFADWMVTILLIILFVGTSTKALFKGIETWKEETIMKKARKLPTHWCQSPSRMRESERRFGVCVGWGTGRYTLVTGEDQGHFGVLEFHIKIIISCIKRHEIPTRDCKDVILDLLKAHQGGSDLRPMGAKHHYYDSRQDYTPLPSGPAALRSDEVSLMDNVYWKDFMLLLFVWVSFLAIQLVKTYAEKCSVEYWILISLQVPIAVSVSLYEAICLYKGNRVIASIGKETTNWKVHQLLLYCFCGITAGVVGGLLGLGGGFILGPLFLELGVPPQVASATSTFAMAFSSSMSVIQYYLLKRFPVPYAAYFVLVATIAAFTGQHIVRKLIMLLGRASLIIFILALTIFVSAISLGGVGIANIVEKLVNHEHIGFESMCQS
ncbi:hypothetical protein IFM89_016242 [Coptis chinensis]|uniref:Sulfite exporter TauE/SafE family protein n=1 Tax=Coptis chinensis TaxID=261450 RepID=A0A835LY97_9MAGN|nr:hypothetical protein IFM89_016242 [Coptis chinensis]